MCPLMDSLPLYAILMGQSEIFEHITFGNKKNWVRSFKLDGEKMNFFISLAT